MPGANIIMLSICCSLTVGAESDDVLLGDPLCGVTEIEPRIVNGLRVPPKRFPWSVLIQVTNFELKKSGNCGGTIITERHVLTAGHCLYVGSKRSAPFRIRYGNSVLERTSVIIVSHSILHPGYDDDTLLNDIAILVLPSPLVFSRYVGSACLPANADLTLQDRTGVVAGWGYTSEGGRKRPQPVMLYVTQVIQRQRYCERVLADYSYNPDSTFCAYKRGYDACQGDSGGGFVSPLNGRWFLLGIISFGIGCGKPGVPGVYTDIRRYLPWIAQKVKETSAE